MPNRAPLQAQRRRCASDGPASLWRKNSGRCGGSATGRPGAPADQPARDFAVDPRNNVVLEASAGTGKTGILVTRYLNLLRAGVDPASVLAITFTRKAAAEMRERIVAGLRADAAIGGEGARRWRELRDRIGEISISTIDAFCLRPAARVPARGRPRPGRRDGRRDGGPASGGRHAGPHAPHRAAAVGARRRGGAASRRARRAALRETLGSLVAKRLTAGRRLGRFLARTPGPAGSRPGRPRACWSRWPGRWRQPAASRRFSRAGPSVTRRSGCSRPISKRRLARAGLYPGRSRTGSRRTS